MKEATEQYLAHLRTIGKNERTIYTYGKDLELAVAYFGEDKDIAKIMPVHVAQFFKADTVNKLIREPKEAGKPRQEKPKSPITITKTKRVFRMMLVFCRNQGWLDKVPLPKDELSKVKESAEVEAAEGEQTAASAE
ncbi:MAG: hypothetical protein KJZ87_16275 [Thermoguttaceae bacterium]|nr:hypothetical protein [Thermoguttaceae bacterium]